jgi:hypothetical protein
MILYKNLFSTTFISGEDERDLQNLHLADIEIIVTLGVGGFGRVELVNNWFFFNYLFELNFSILGSRYPKYEEI